MNDTSRPLVELHDIAAAFGLLSRLPVPVDHARAGARGAGAGWAWPLAGAVLGGIAGAVGWLGTVAGLPPGVAAGLALVVLVVLTGALHEDGLADCADGLGGGADRARALDIMKDSRIGAFGAVALVLALGLRWQAIAALPPALLVPALAAVGAASRAAMLAAMRWMPPARAGGLSAATGLPPAATVWLGLALGLVPLLPLAPLALLTLALAPLPLAWLAQRRIGGQTGDVLGGVQQLAEIGCLLGLVIALS